MYYLLATSNPATLHFMPDDASTALGISDTPKTATPTAPAAAPTKSDNKPVEQITTRIGAAFQQNPKLVEHFSNALTPAQYNPPQPPNAFEQARQQYPVLNNYDIGYKESIGRGPGYMESWPPGEGGTPKLSRPKEFANDKFGVENFRADTKPIDVLGDVVSHYLVTADPQVKQTYSDFSASLQPWQHKILQSQYQYAQKVEGEKRPYEAWLTSSGLPAYFRGYAFKQWPDDFNQHAYTPEQRQMLDGMMNYLSKKP